jgi:hypothetical protein
MLDSNVVAILVPNLGDSQWYIRESAALVLAELAKHSAHSDPGAMPTLT